MIGYNLVGTATPPVKSFIGNLRISSGPNKCLDIAQDNEVAGQTLQEYDCNSNSNAQNFQMVPLSNGYYNIKSINGLCMDVFSGSVTDGGAVGLWTCNGQTNQMWAFKDLGNTLFKLQPVHALQSNMCLDNSNGVTNNGNKIQIMTCGTNPKSQVWTISMPPALSGFEHRKLFTITCFHCLKL